MNAQTQSRPANRFWATVSRPPWRTIVPAVLLLCVLLSIYAVWSPGLEIKDGRFDLQKNGIWIQHGWLGDDDWFRKSKKPNAIGTFRDAAKIRELANLLRNNHITEVFPHLCPTR